MVGYFGDRYVEGNFTPRLGPVSASFGWRKQLRNAQRIDPEPSDFKVFRVAWPGIQHNGLPDLLRSNSVPIVSDAFRQIVLSLEPDMHQFVPIALFDEESQQPLPGTYWVMNVLRRLDCVIEADQIMTWRAEGHALPDMEGFWRTRPNGSLAPSAKVLYVDRSRIQGLHLWRALWRIAIKNDVGLDLFFSDELVKRVENVKLRTAIRQAVEISAPTGR